MSKYDVVIKKIEPIKIASVRGIVPTPPQQGPLWAELEGYLAAQHIRPAGPCFALYHDDEYKEHDWDIEACEPISGELKTSERVKVHTLPAVETMASSIHHGPFTTISEAYNAIAKWIEANGYRTCGPGREIYLHVAEEGQGMVSQTDPETVTEIQFPVAKA
jgi:effector-binding domain-containing protein